MQSQTQKFCAHWHQALLHESSTLEQALHAMNASQALIGVVVLKSGGMAVITDSDIRKALLRGAKISDSVLSWSNHKPVLAKQSQSEGELEKLVEKFGVREIPLLDDNGDLSDIYISRTWGRGSGCGSFLPHAMFILAGGLGQRLKSVVSDRPKPLAEVGDKPILQTLILRARSSGIRKFYVSVNFMAEKLEEHLDLEIYSGLDIEVIKEPFKMGTAGSLGLIPQSLSHPLLVTNADILTTVPFERILHAHFCNQADITCAVREHQVQVPYGVMSIDDDKITNISEKKATHHYNAGIYVIGQKILSTIPKNQHLDMPELIEQVIRGEGRVVPFLIHEYWTDVGRPDDYWKANQEYFDVFQKDVP